MTKIYTKERGISAGMLILSFTIYVLVLNNPNITVTVGEPGTFYFTTVDRGTLYIYGLSDENSSTEFGKDVEFLKLVKYDGGERQPTRVLSSPKTLSDGTTLPAGTLQFLGWGYRDRAGMGKTWPNNQFEYIPLRSGKHHFVLVFGTEKGGYLKLDAYNNATLPDKVPLKEIQENVFACKFQNYDGKWVRCSDAEMGTVNYPYLITENSTHYIIEGGGETLPPIPKEGTHNFGMNRIEWSFLIEKATPATMRNSINAKEISRTNFSYFIYEEPTYFDSNGTQIDINNDTQLLHKNTTYPLIVVDPWIVNSTEGGGWNVTFSNSNTDVNESVIPDIDDSLHEDALIHLTFDNRNATHFLDENTTNAHDATITGAVQDVGWRNKSVKCDGINDFLSTPWKPTHNASEAITYVFWGKVENVDAGNLHFTSRGNVISEMYKVAAVGYMRYTLKINDVHTIRLTISAILENDTWTHIAQTYNGTTIVFYVNGIEHNRHAVTGQIGYDVSKALELCRRSGAAFWLNGSIDEYMIFGRGLTASEIQTLYNGSHFADSNISAPPLGQYRDAGSGNGIVNITVNVTLDGNATMDLYLNHSTDASTWNLELVQSGISANTNYTPTNKDRYWHVIPECINTGGGICHIHEIVIHEATVETDPPDITIESPENITYNSLTTEFNVTLDEEGDWCGYSLDGATNVTMTNSSGNWNAQNTTMANGSHNVTFACNDTVGNMNHSAFLYFTMNQRPDTQIFVRQANGTYIEDDIFYDLFCSFGESGCQPDNQDSTTPLLHVKNNGSGNGAEIQCKVNATVDGITAGMSNTSTCGSPRNAPTVNVSGLEAGWHFDEGSGTNATDFTGNNNHGTISGATYTTGYFDTGLDFDGINDYIDVSSVNLNGQEAMSIFSWINIDSVSSNDEIFDGGTNITFFTLHNSMANIGDEIRCIVSNHSNSIAVATSDFNLVTDNWYNIVCTYNGTNVVIYKDAVASSSIGSMTGPLADFNNSVIGLRWSSGAIESGNEFDGIMDEVQIYNRSLSSDEILLNYERSLSNNLTTRFKPVWNETIAPGTNRSIWICEDWVEPPTFDIIEYQCEVI